MSERKLFLFGRYSLALLLPKKWLRELEIGAGSSVRLEFDKTRQRIVVRLDSTNAPKATTKPLKTKKKTGDGDWQPIPQL